jgi:hypothetical protein
LLSFTEELERYSASRDHGSEQFPAGELEGRNASPDEILHALQEALALPRPFTALQTRYRDLDPQGPLGVTLARVSEYFLQKHRDLLGGP